MRILDLVSAAIGGLALLALPCFAGDHSVSALPATQIATPTNSLGQALSAPLTSPSATPTFELKASEPSPELQAGKKWRIGGPLVSIFKGGKIRQAPGRFFRAINPFRRAAEERSAGSEAEFERYQDISPRAWSTSVGWHPIRSGPPDPVTHEGGITLIDISSRER
jgi:hypothetical protein